jgi:hypothetical protein
MRPRDVALLAAVALVAMQPVDSHAAEANKSGHRPIYRCKVNGVTTFSDRACGDTIEPYRMEFDNATQASRPGKHPESKARQEAAPRPARKPVEPSSPGSRQEACERLDQDLRKIRSQMRAGYSVKEGERLKGRLAGIQERRKAQKC